MRAIKVTLMPNEPATFPLAYNSIVQGLLYSCWKDRFPELHDVGFGENRTLRLFTFSPLTGQYRINKAEKTITFTSAVSFEVRTPIEELLDELAHQLSIRRTIRLGSSNMALVNLEARDRLYFPQRIIAKAIAPIVAYTTLGDGHTRYYSPDDSEWHGLIQNNAQSKLSLFGLTDETGITLIPRIETIKKHVTTFKGTYITGWTGEFIAAADPTALSILYFTGLGAKNSQGFGMFNILDERP